MTNTLDTKKITKARLSNASKDLIMIFIVNGIIFILAYHFNVFVFLMELFQKNPKAITWVDETVTGLLTLSIGLAVFAWRRWLELKKEAAGRIKLQEQLITIAETKAETANIICKQLRSEIEYHRSRNK